ncbi:conserved hypothetical protein [Carnobacterium maltaromaticum]|uniref:hypothetical protein n=1 Tax=Carnobacterium maltaromaticum TaxID=2751 RepID=UPI00070530ED|nr:hypothetical protein [Carnobacterium maltaromaticum]KRN71351.1 hypothetical protein IV76_GL000850 [Carnobacterium maltaromaticum]CRH18748.1 conserved hypothetical protein [Carnobacterium maltaromaticum]
MLNRFNERYVDRGVVKWMGMFLSEHTASIQRDKKKRSFIVEKKEQMNENDIYSILNEAITNNSMIIIQVEEINTDGNYQEDLIGWIEGYEDSYIYLSGNKIALESIRNIQLYSQLKWSKNGRHNSLSE